MASCSGTSSNSSSRSNLSPNSGSEVDLQAALDHEKKRRRMLSNRESARRSRLRKQKHLDELIAQANLLTKNNGQILSTLNLRTQQYLLVESQNSVLRTEMMELISRLNSLTEILHYMYLNDTSAEIQVTISNNFVNTWNYMPINNPIMSSDVNHYY